MGKYRYLLRGALILALTLCIGIFMAACSEGGSDVEEEAVVSGVNPLTGATEEEGYDPAADNQRIGNTLLTLFFRARSKQESQELCGCMQITTSFLKSSAR